MDFAVLRHFEEVTHSTDHILVICGLLEVRERSLCGELLESGRHMVIKIHDALLDGLIHDCRECCGRVVELAA